jgi:drug/metabolite transporter (DMT)-like permease
VDTTTKFRIPETVPPQDTVFSLPAAYLESYEKKPDNKKRTATMTMATEHLRDDFGQAAGRSKPQGRRQLLGTALVILSTISIAVVPSFAKLAYDGGSNTLTVITARSILTVVLTWLVIISLRQAVRINRKPLLISLGTGVCYAVMLYGFLGAVAFIPINIVILIYFIHPILVGLLAARLGDEAMSTKMVAALVVAFAGLGLAVGFSFDALDLRGIGLAALAMVTCVFVIIGNGRAVQQAGGLVVVFYMMLSTAIALALLFLFFGTVELPTTASGWFGFTGVAISSTIGTLAFFCAVPMIGTVRSTMISNVEPLLGIILAVLILGEKISMLQIGGVAMVLASIVAMELK